jgi:hypothetical protein
MGEYLIDFLYMTNDGAITVSWKSIIFFCDEIKKNGELLGRTNERSAAPTFFMRVMMKVIYMIEGWRVVISKVASRG